MNNAFLILLLILFSPLGYGEMQQRDPFSRSSLPITPQGPLSDSYLSLRLIHINAKSLLTLLPAIGMSKTGKAAVDERSNTLKVRDTPQALQAIEREIKSLDIALPQIQLTAHIVTMNKTLLNELGVSWGIISPSEVSGVLAGSHLGGSQGAGLQLLATLPLKLTQQLLSLELHALEQENQVNILASPSLITMHQQVAMIKQGTEIPYEVKSGDKGAFSIEFKEAVLGMNVKPTILANERIHLTVNLSQNMPGRSIKRGDGELLAIDKQEIQTSVILKNGETMVLGGIFQQQETQGIDGVPWLSRLALIGPLFRHEMAQKQHKELVVFITPSLVY